VSRLSGSVAAVGIALLWLPWWIAAGVVVHHEFGGRGWSSVLSGGREAIAGAASEGHTRGHLIRTGVAQNVSGDGCEGLPRHQ